MLAKTTLITIALLASSALTGCSLAGGDKKCDRAGEYKNSQEITPMQVSSEFDEPDRSTGLTIPGEPNNADKPAKEQPCLEHPPSYF